MIPFRKRRGRGGQSQVSVGMRFEACRVVDHPVCGAAVASRLLMDAAATPPWQGGENAQTQLYAASRLLLTASESLPGIEPAEALIQFVGSLEI